MPVKLYSVAERSYVNIKYKMDSWGTPDLTGYKSDVSPFSLVLNFLSDKNDFKRVQYAVGKICLIIFNRPSSQTLYNVKEG